MTTWEEEITEVAVTMISEIVARTVSNNGPTKSGNFGGSRNMGGPYGR